MDRQAPKAELPHNLNASIPVAFIMAGPLEAIYKAAIPIGIAIALGNAAMYDVKGGSRAVIFDRLSGVKEQVVNEGTHFLIPWLQKSIIYDVRTKPRNISTTTGSKDLQMVSLTLRVLHRPEVQKLPKIYQVCMSASYTRLGERNTLMPILTLVLVTRSRL
jgi:regulator of protease activity HflC (stomatin/prohibitin superfamily)